MFDTVSVSLSGALGWIAKPISRLLLSTPRLDFQRSSSSKYSGVALVIHNQGQSDVVIVVPQCSHSHVRVVENDERFSVHIEAAHLPSTDNSGRKQPRWTVTIPSEHHQTFALAVRQETWNNLGDDQVLTFTVPWGWSGRNWRHNKKCTIYKTVGELRVLAWSPRVGKQYVAAA